MVHGQRDDLETSIEIVFSYQLEGRQSLYRVKRSWEVGSQDKLTIHLNDEEMTANYEQAQADLLELVPPGIADLVFFDGEKIADLAEDTSGVILKQAVKRLLGLDIISRLKADLEIYLKKQGMDAANSKIRKIVESLETEKKSLLHEAEDFRKLADQKSRSITEINVKIKNAEQEVMTGGGAWAEDKEAERAKVERLLQQKTEHENAILRELDGFYALSLAPKTMQTLLDVMSKDKELRARKILSEEFTKLVPVLLEKADSSEQQINNIQNVINEYSRRGEDESIKLGLSDAQSGSLELQISHLSHQSKERVIAQKKLLNKTLTQIEHASINISRAPEKEQLKEALEKLSILQSEKQKLVMTYRNYLEQVKVKLSEAHQKASRLVKLQSELKKSTGNDEGVRRAENAIQLINDLSTSLIETRLLQLEKEFIDSYKRLARKEDLQIHAQIDPISFDVVLLDEDNHAINRKQLSAGEKQIYAISMLDALARVSGRKLPLVIDTPLGRLDSHHRDKLVNNYFPYASDQVIILSTDTEIDEEFFSALEPSIARSYEIVFDTSSKSSTVVEGYFWKLQMKEAG
jgi:DNA sulfur modification protein DndD